MTIRRIATFVFVLMVVLTACVSSEESAGSAPWGGEAVAYFEELSLAYRDNNYYGVLDFYAASAEVEKWRGAVRGGLPVSDLLRWNSGDLSQELESVYFGGDGALTLVLWPRSGDQAAIVSTIEEGRIARETVFELAASLGRSLRASPEVISTYEGLYSAFAKAWSGEGTDYRTRIYGREASVRDALSGIEVSGREAILALRSPGIWSASANTDHSGSGASAQGPSIYLGPRDYAQDPQRAVGVYEVTDASGCTRRVAVLWILANGLIVEERHYAEVESFRRCATGPRPTGWWTALPLPEPSDRVVTGVLSTAGGNEVAVRNGTMRLEGLVRYGLERFAVAGLDEPSLDTVTFEPSRSCADRSGRLLDDAGSRDLFICIYESDLCSGDTKCSTPTLSARNTVLHELGHAWIVDRVGDETQQQILDLSGRETWASLDVPWPERGAEYSAEVIAWGLLDQAIPPVRINTPPCEELRTVFRLLTGVEPLRTASDCPGM